jgi:DtxR family Mn-dependent transcriptional regulator
MHSKTTEDYLKAIYKLSKDGTQKVSTNEIAHLLDVKSSSVTDMLNKLLAKKLINYEKYKGVNLSSEGKRVALSIIRKHRLWESFLVYKLKFNWGEVHKIAEQLEHIQSKLLINRLDDFLGNPHFDPHGDPIPDKNGKIIKRTLNKLSELKTGHEAELVGVNNDTESLLEYLDKIGLNINSRFKIMDHLAFDNSLLVKIGSNKVQISKKIADNLLVKSV